MIGFIIMGAVGIACMVIGLLIWRKEKISLLHDYHYDQVSEKDKKAFCAISGMGITAMGTGILISGGLLGLTNSLWSFIPFLIGMIVCITLQIFAEKKYNSAA